MDLLMMQFANFAERKNFFTTTVTGIFVRIAVYGLRVLVTKSIADIVQKDLKTLVSKS
jgi:hypothetical protein